MTKVIPEIQYRIAKKIIDGDYPIIRNRIFNIINKVAAQITNTAIGLVTKLARDGIYLDYDVQRESHPDGVTVCLRFKLKAVDPVKLGMLNVIIDFSRNDPAFRTLLNTNLMREVLSEAIMEYIAKRASQDKGADGQVSIGDEDDDSEPNPNTDTQP